MANQEFNPSENSIILLSVLKYITGEVVQINRTNRTIYLSNNTHWNAHTFHQNVQLLRMFMNREISIDPTIQLMQNAVKSTIDAMKKQCPMKVISLIK